MNSRLLLSSTRSFRLYLYRNAKQVPKNLKNKSKSSQEWITRQLSDPYVEKARMMNYRCRSAFKLLEIDEKYKILNPGDVVIDCGAAPGSWTQVAVQKSNSKGTAEPGRPAGKVISIDLLAFHPIEGATIFSGMDFTKMESQRRIVDALQGRLANNVLSDMAPNATGVRMLDQDKIVQLGYDVLRFALNVSATNANLLIKLWDNPGAARLEKDMLKFYEKVRRVKPPSSRSDSAEMFLLARGFKGLHYVENLLKNKKQQ